MNELQWLLQIADARPVVLSHGPVKPDMKDPVVVWGIVGLLMALMASAVVASGGWILWSDVLVITGIGALLGMFLGLIGGIITYWRYLDVFELWISHNSVKNGYVSNPFRCINNQKVYKA